jgi:hypothetical protein
MDHRCDSCGHSRPGCTLDGQFILVAVRCCLSATDDILKMILLSPQVMLRMVYGHGASPAP